MLSVISDVGHDQKSQKYCQMAVLFCRHDIFHDTNNIINGTNDIINDIIEQVCHKSDGLLVVTYLNVSIDCRWIFLRKNPILSDLAILYKLWL